MVLACSEEAAGGDARRTVAATAALREAKERRPVKSKTPGDWPGA